MRRSPRALVLLLALAWSDKRDELRELHRQHRQHRHRGGADAAAGAPPAPESDVPHLRARSQYIADALLGQYDVRGDVQRLMVVLLFLCSA